MAPTLVEPSCDDKVKETSSKSTSTAAESSIDDNKSNGIETAKEKLTKGKSYMACELYPQAVEEFAVACQLLATEHGEDSVELADPYYYYGRSLLDLARTENGVLGNALDGVAAEEENEADLSECDQFEKASGIQEDEREKVRNDVYSAMSAEEKEKAEEADKADKTADKGEKMTDDKQSEESKSVEESDKTSTEVGDSEVNTAETSTADEVEDKTEDAVESEDAAGDTAEEEEEEAEGDEEDIADENVSAEEGTSSQEEDTGEFDDVPNLQVAWEVLELSKKIYTKLTEVEGCEKAVKLKLAEVYKTLGEVSLETGTYEQAIQDIEHCLEIQQICCEPDDRLLAETHYQLGNFHSTNKDYKAAITDLCKAKSIIEERIKNNEQKLSGELEEEQRKLVQKDLDECKQFLPDMISRVEDAEDESRNAEKAEAEVKAAICNQKDGGATTTIGFGDSSSTPATTITAKKANDISNLIRKRKTDESEVEVAKKAKSDQDTTAAGDKENGAVIPEVAPGGC